MGLPGGIRMKRIHKVYYADTETSFKKAHRTFYRTPEGPFGAIKDIAVGNRHTLLIAEDGTLWGCGANNSCQLGMSSAISFVYEFVKLSTATDWVMVGAGFDRSIALKSDGTVWIAGVGNYTIGSGKSTPRPSWDQLLFYLKPNGDGSPEGGAGNYYQTAVTNATKVYANGTNRYVVANHKLYRVTSQLDNTTYCRAVYSWGSFDHYEPIPISKFFIGPTASFALGYDANFPDENDSYNADLNLQLYFTGNLPGYYNYAVYDR